MRCNRLTEWATAWLVLLPIWLCYILVATDATEYSKFSVPKLIESDGYKVEVHHVTTEDGYILELHRIPFGMNDSNTIGRRPPVLLAHCILCTSAAFVVLGPTRALAYILANNGYDVWMLNSRGSTYSQKHIYLRKESTKFWKFSFHEMGIYDLPACIDYALSVTGEGQLDFIGFSMGAAEFLVLTSERPEYNAKIKRMIALAPAVFMNSSTGQFPFPPFLKSSIVKYGIRTGLLQFPPAAMNFNLLSADICRYQNTNSLGSTCAKILEDLGGANNGNINPKALPFFLHHYPDVTSIRAMVHYSQLRNSARFTKYNFGKAMNKQKYGSRRPPVYDFSKVSAPISIFRSRADDTVKYNDIERLKSELPNVEFIYDVPLPNFSHMDFVWSRNAKVLVYDVVLRRLSLD